MRQSGIASPVIVIIVVSSSLHVVTCRTPRLLFELFVGELVPPGLQEKSAGFVKLELDVLHPGIVLQSRHSPVLDTAHLATAIADNLYTHRSGLKWKSEIIGLSHPCIVQVNEASLSELVWPVRQALWPVGLKCFQPGFWGGKFV